MKIFLDTASLKEIQEANAMGLLDGVTTNPSLIAKEGKGFRETLEAICRVVKGPVNGEVVATDTEGMVAEGRKIAKLAPNMVVKIPLIPPGLKAVKALSSEGIRVNVTLCFNATQALLAAKSGASYISPFVGRLDDCSEDGMEVVRQIKRIYDNYGYKTEILAASLRHPLHVRDAALAGAHISTIPYAVFEKLFGHPLTDRGLQQFLKDWEKVPKKDILG